MVRIAIGILIFFAGLSAHAQVLFEGYSKILSGGVHVGYVINRYSYDVKKKQFESISFLKTNEFGGNLTESLVATAGEDFKPLAYQYTTVLNNQVKTIDAKISGNKLLATVKNAGKSEKISRDLPKGAFLSTFLGYVMLKSPKGITADAKYEYQAVAEEVAAILKGLAVVKNKEDYQGLKVYRVLNEFKNSKFVSFVNDKGEVLSSKSPVLGISTELVAQPSLATSGMTVPAVVLKELFGDVPVGQQNELSQAKHAASAIVEPVSPKSSGVPAGKGIQLKGKTSK